MGTMGLGQFLQFVPSCVETEILACLTSCFEQGKSEAVVVVDEAHYPIGIVQLSQWLAHRSHYSDLANGNHNGYDGLSIQSVAIAPVHWQVHQFRDYVQSLNTNESEKIGRSPLSSLPQWVLVDQHGAYLGVLDERALWRSLALGHNTHARTSSSPSSAEPISTESSSSIEGDRPIPPSCPVSSPYSFRNLLQLQGLFDPADASPLPTEIVDYSIRLLENTPFPVIVQTGEGRVILQNEAWQQCIRELEHPETVRQQLAQLFEETRPIDQDTVPAVFCEFGNSQHDCICTCSTKDGQYRTWKFTKVLLPVSPSPVSSSPVSSSPVTYPVGPSIGLTNLEGASREEVSRDGASRDGASREEAIAPSTLSASSPQQESFQLASLLQQNESYPSTSFYADPALLFQEARQLWMVIAQDMTAQHRLSDALMAQNARLVKSNRIKDELFTYLTHELKTPLTAILGLSNLLKDEAFGALNERQTQYANLLYKSGRQLASLVNKVLTLTHLEAGDFQLNPEWVHLLDLCEQAYSEALESQGILPPPHSSGYPVLISEHLTFDLDVQPDALHSFIDKLRLKQILVQLLTNAIKFSRLEGEITLHVRRCHQWLVFEISDTGIGIPTQYQPSILQTFQNFDDATARTVEGSGLGLFLVNKLVEAQKGAVSFISQEGEGSRFTVLLPFCTSPAQADENRATDSPSMSDQSAGHPNFGTLRSTPSIPKNMPDPLQGTSVTFSPQATQPSPVILIVENDPTTVAQLVASIDAEGEQPECHHKGEQPVNDEPVNYEIVIARSESEVWQKIRTLHPCGILLNLTATEFLGTDLLKALKANPETQSIPVMTLSASATVEEAKRLGADSHITQPRESSSIKQYLKRWEQAPPSNSGAKPITVLYINPDKALTEIQAPNDAANSTSDVSPLVASSENRNTAELSAILHPYHCRVLEIDDISQAGILSRVWNPDVMLLSAQTSDPDQVLNILSEHTDLKKLPIITLTLNHTEIANQLKGFKVFPCLNLSTLTESQLSSYANISPLVEVIRVAAGVHRIPRIAILSVSLPAIDTEFQFGDELQLEEAPESDAQQSFTLSSVRNSQHAERLAALVKYFQMAGIHASIQVSTEAIASCISQGTVDGALIYQGATQGLSDHSISQVLEDIKRLDPQFPVVIWLDDVQETNTQRAVVTDGPHLGTVAAEVMIGAHPMHEVVEVLQRAIAHP
ncbi:MAG: hybrid sensor histidine kinase/response regulator [Leptolyngbyaceae bacterium]|nr:hybrid sensor histidine kinase/response regulator [Leptolyngbyaceae bacterium]